MCTLSSGGASATVDPVDGGRLTSLIVAGVELLGGATPAPGAPVGWFHGIFPMAPYAGRLKDATFRFDGTTYTVPPNEGRNAGHGLVFDVPWQIEDGVAEDVGGAAHLTLAAELDGRWPLGGTVTEAITLAAGCLSLTLTVSNDRRSMPASLGFHPWFRRRVGAGGPARIGFRPRRRYAPDADGFPRWPGPELGERPWDDVFEGLHEPPTISWPGGPKLALTADTQTWTVYERRQWAFCIEPLSAPPDTLGTPRAAVVRPGEPLSLTMRLSW